MNKNVFRSVQFWKSAIMTLPDSSFFELMRSVFGKIKTPFNKQILSGDLEQFLRRADIQNAIACYIGPDDARIIAAVAALDEPALDAMETFFADEMNCAELRGHVINLEERCIVYRFWEKDICRLALNPVLEPVLSPYAADTFLLFPSAPPGEITHNEPPPFNDRVLAGLVSFVLETGAFFKTGGGIRKKVIDSAHTLFPGLAPEAVIGGLRTLGLFRADDERLVPDFRRLAEFGKLSRRERLEYCAAGICFFSAAAAEGAPPEEISPWLCRGQVQFLAGFIHRFLDSLDTERRYPRKTLNRLAYFAGRDSADQSKAGGAFVMQALEETGLLLALPDAWYRVLPAPGNEITANEKTAKNPVIAMDTSFSFLVYPEIRFHDMINLAAISSVLETGMAVRFRIDRASALRAFNAGFSADAMIDLLKRLSLNRIDETLIWTLHDWEKRYGEVTLRQGLVLTLAAERRYLAETAPLSRLIGETLAPGVYLLREDAETAAVEALRKAGVDIVARRGADRSGGGADNETAGLMRGFFSPLASAAQSSHYRQLSAVSPPSREPTGGDSPQASALIEGFRSILEQMRLGKEERDELAGRIERRLILCESQLRDAVVRYEKLEARGLDYVGKSLIAKQAIALRSPLELALPASGGGETIYGIPKALEKENGETVLVINPLGDNNAAGTDTRKIPLGKISLIRRIKQSIFENGPGAG